MSQHKHRAAVGKALRDRGWTKYRLAMEAGVPIPTVYRWLSDRKNIRKATLDRILGAVMEGSKR